MEKEQRERIAKELEGISALLAHKYVTEQNTIKILNNIVNELRD
jgi:hypothetical protein